MRVIPQLLSVAGSGRTPPASLLHPSAPPSNRSHVSSIVLADAGQSVVTNSGVLFIILNALLHKVDSIAKAFRGLGDTAAIRKRAAYPVDPIVVQNTSGSTFWKTNRASPCTYHAPDPNHNHRDIYTPMRPTWYAVLSCITDAMMQVRVETAPGCFSA